MDVMTGKDIPGDFERQNSKLKVDNLEVGYYRNEKVRIWGYDLVEPDCEFNVSQFRKFANVVIKDIYKRGKLPIVVGGTGLYIDSIVKTLDKIDIPKDEDLRNDLSKLGVNELYRQLLRLRPQIALEMNPSDRSNPRRLIRAIEVANNRAFDTTSDMNNKVVPNIKFDSILWIGLIAKPREKLHKAIDERVDRRVSPDMQKEIDYLGRNDLLRYAPTQTIGYREWMKYLKGDLTREEAIDKWKASERNYAKRQLSWFNRNKKIAWHNVAEPDFRKKIEIEVRKWYSSDNDK
jgi:tRNA dimethylallyltransferase